MIEPKSESSMIYLRTNVTTIPKIKPFIILAVLRRSV